MCSVVELHLAIFCAILPRLGYTILIDWIRENKHSRISGIERQRRTIGNPAIQGFNGEGVPLNNIPTHNVEDNNRASDHRLYEEGEYNGRQNYNLPHNDMLFNNRQYGYRPYNDRGHEDMADYHRPFQARTIE